MKTRITFSKIRFASVLFLAVAFSSYSQVLTSDSLALVALYNATDGPNWNNSNNWLTEPVDEWHGVTTTGNRVTLLGWLSGNGLSGNIPPELGNLSELRTLYLQGNDLTGAIPSELGNLSNLEVLYMYNNQLSGSIPNEIGNLSKLEELILSNNQLTGSLPKELGSLSDLTDLSIAQNQLSGSIPAELGDLASLKWLLLWGNELTGEIPSELGNLSDILRLNVYDNQLEGELPSELGGLPLIRDLSVSENNLSGAIPASFSQLTTLQTFIISLNQFNDLPDLTSLTGLTLFDVSSNCFGEDEILLNQSVITTNTGQNECSVTIAVDSQPTDIEECEGSTVSFLVTASGTINLQYQWQEDQGSGFENLSDGGVYEGALSSELILSDVQSSMDGFHYRCVVSGDNADDMTSNSAVLGVSSVPSPPTVTDNSGCVLETMELTASGGANGSYRWYNAATGGTAISGEVNSTFTTPALTSTASYYVSLTNGICESSRTEVVAGIIASPSVDIQPADQTINEGASVSFSVTASGQDLTYQWQKDGVDISDATLSALSLNSVSLSDAGSYQCQVMNDCGTITSNTATLTVNDVLNVNESLLKIYPNPSYGQLFIDGRAPGRDWSVLLLDLSGKGVAQFKLIQGKNSLDISSLVRGIYWVEIRRGEELVHNQRIVLR